MFRLLVRSGTNDTMRNHLRGIAETAMDLVGHKPGACVLDIGCNDGTLLRCYPDDYDKYGVDPSHVAQEIGAAATVVQDIFPSAELTKRLGDKRCDIVTSIAMFYDLEDPIAFTQGIKAVLAPEGVWILEMSYMPMMLGMNSYDTICHEHLEYYSLAIIEYILRAAGMKVFNVATNDINGGSLRYYASTRTTSLSANPSSPRVSGRCARTSSTWSWTPTSLTSASKTASTSTARS